MRTEPEKSVSEMEEPLTKRLRLESGNGINSIAQIKAVEEMDFVDDTPKNADLAIKQEVIEEMNFVDPPQNADLAIKQETVELDVDEQRELATQFLEESDGGAELIEKIKQEAEECEEAVVLGVDATGWSHETRFDEKDIYDLVSGFAGELNKKDFKKVSDRIICRYDFDANAADLVYAYVDVECLVKPDLSPNRRNYFNAWPDEPKFYAAFEIFKKPWMNHKLHHGHANAAANWIGDVKLFQASQNFVQFFPQTIWFNSAVNLANEKTMRKIFGICGAAVMAHGAIYGKDIDGHAVEPVVHFDGKLKIASLFYTVILIKNALGQLFQMTFILNHKKFEPIGAVKNSLFDIAKLNALGVENPFPNAKDVVEITNDNLNDHMPWFDTIQKNAIAETHTILRFGGREVGIPKGVECIGFGETACYRTKETGWGGRMYYGSDGTVLCINCYYRRFRSSLNAMNGLFSAGIPKGVECIGFGETKCSHTYETVGRMRCGSGNDFLCNNCYSRRSRSSLNAVNGLFSAGIPKGVECIGFGETKCSHTYETVGDDRMRCGFGDDFLCINCYSRRSRSALKAMNLFSHRIPKGVECIGFGETKCNHTYETSGGGRMRCGSGNDFLCNNCYSRRSRSRLNA